MSRTNYVLFVIVKVLQKCQRTSLELRNIHSQWITLGDFNKNITLSSHHKRISWTANCQIIDHSSDKNHSTNWSDNQSKTKKRMKWFLLKGLSDLPEIRRKGLQFCIMQFPIRLNTVKIKYALRLNLWWHLESKSEFLSKTGDYTKPVITPNIYEY